MKRIVFEKKQGDVSVSLGFDADDKLTQNLKDCLDILSELSDEIERELYPGAPEDNKN